MKEKDKEKEKEDFVTKAKEKYKIFVDSGHGTNPFTGEYDRYPEGVYDYLIEQGLPTSDKTTYNYHSGVKGETEINWRVSTKLVDLLEQDENFLVKRDRETKTEDGLSNKDRSVKANEWGADLRVSIHADRTGSGGYFVALPHEDFVLPEEFGGYYTESIRDETEIFAEILLESLDNSELNYGIWNDGIYRPPKGYTAYNFTKHPVVILEMINTKNWDDTLKKEDVQDEIVKSTYEAIKVYFLDK